jgi:hypothetical protein
MALYNSEVDIPMTDPLENDVREALRHKACFVPDQSIERVSSIDYDPRAARWPQTVRAAIANFIDGVRRCRRGGR